MTRASGWRHRGSTCRARHRKLAAPTGTGRPAESRGEIQAHRQFPAVVGPPRRRLRLPPDDCGNNPTPPNAVRRRGAADRSGRIGQYVHLQQCARLPALAPRVSDLSLQDIRDGTAALTLRDVRDGRYSRLRSLSSQCPTRKRSGCFGPTLSRSGVRSDWLPVWLPRSRTISGSRFRLVSAYPTVRPQRDVSE
jgi:hypothetical protein